jgi:toxin secretion/phage lysis holin
MGAVAINPMQGGGKRATMPNLGAAVKWAVAAAIAVWVSIPAAVQALLILMALDYATGLLRAAIAREVSAEVGWRGLQRKTMTTLLVVSAHYLGRTLHLGYDVGTLVASAFGVNEVISITENAATAGLPVPPVLLDVLSKAKHLTGRGKSAHAVRRELGGRER